MKKFWKGLLANLGLLILVGGVAYLTYIIYIGIQTNLTLAVSTGIILIGFVLYILLNKKVN